MSEEPVYHRFDKVEYIAEQVFDGIIDTGDFGVVLSVEKGWVRASWRSGVHGVPLENVRPAPPLPSRVVTREGNERIWDLIGEELPPLPNGKPRDPYWHQGSHPEIVDRVWDELGNKLPADCRAQAKGKPVLAHPITNRIFAIAHGMRYAIWLTPDDFQDAGKLGAQTVMQWTGGSITDLATAAGPGWIWGRWYAPELEWLRHSFRAVDEPPGSRTRDWPEL